MAFLMHTGIPTLTVFEVSVAEYVFGRQPYAAGTLEMYGLIKNRSSMGLLLCLKVSSW